MKSKTRDVQFKGEEVDGILSGIIVVLVRNSVF